MHEERIPEKIEKTSPLREKSLVNRNQGGDMRTVVAHRQERERGQHEREAPRKRERELARAERLAHGVGAHAEPPRVEVCKRREAEHRERPASADKTAGHSLECRGRGCFFRGSVASGKVATSHTKFFTSKVRKYSYVNPAS